MICGPLKRPLWRAEAAPPSADEAKLKVFISYSRKDMAFVDRLEQALRARGIESLIDRTDILVFEDWWNEIEGLIGSADAVVFVLSPHSVDSKFVLKEIAHASSLSKRLAPIVYQAVIDDAVPEVLRRLNFLFFVDSNAFEASADQLGEALRTNIAWVKHHTEYGEAARRWSAASRPRGLLLRTPVLEEAERWIASRPYDAPTPVEETRTFVAESRRDASRRRNQSIALLSGALVASLALAALAFWQRGIAVEQRQIADQQHQAADTQRKIADDQRSLADAQRKTAEERAALLSTQVSRKFLSDGEIDKALLLTLQAAKSFDDSSAPDAIRLAMMAALDHAGTKRKKLFSNMRVFEVDDALLLFDQGAGDIFKITDSIEPKLLVKGAPSDGSILQLKKIDGLGAYVILRDSLTVELVNCLTGARQKVGQFKELREANNKMYFPASTKITDDGLVVRKFTQVTLDSEHRNIGETPYYQILDAGTRNIFEGELATIKSIEGKGSNGASIALNDKNHGVRIVMSKNKLQIEPIGQDKLLGERIRLGRCVANMPPRVKAQVMGELQSLNTKEKDPSIRDDWFDCTKIGSNYLVQTIHPGDHFDVRSAVLIDSKGRRLDVSQVFNDHIRDEILENYSWANAAIEETGEFRTLRLGMLVSRSAYVFSFTSNSSDFNFSLASSGDVRLNYRHATPVEYGRFIQPDQLLVIDPITGAATVHDLSDSTGGVDYTSKVNLRDHPQAIEPMHHGTCVGYGSPAGYGGGALPDGREVIYRYPWVVVVAGEELQPWADEVPSCFGFSNDWSRMLTIDSRGVTIYNFTQYLKTKKLEDSKIGFISGSNVSSAIFLDSNGEHMVTANHTTYAFLWSENKEKGSWESTVLYQGDGYVAYAEPDLTGRRLIILEEENFGRSVFLYSVGAKAVFQDLESNDQAQATFTKDGKIATSMLWDGWHDLLSLPSLAFLVELAEGALSVDCKPAVPKDYRSSPCWPVQY
jgi:hypothetical protein